MTTKLFFTTVFLLAALNFAQCQNYWVMSDSNAKGKNIITKKVAVLSFDVYTLNLTGFTQALKDAPMRGDNLKGNDLQLTFPNTEGQFVTYSVVEAPVLHPDLGAIFPEIKSYAGQGIEDPSISIRFSVSTQRGLYGMIFNGDNGTNFIDPYSTDLTEYMVYSKKNMIRTDAADFVCTMTDEDNHSTNEKGGIKATNDKKLRKYSLALCCNAEYGNLFVGSATTNHQKYLNILAQMNITMTRVNGVYEKDLAITMEIIPNDTLIIYFGSTGADPWTTEFNTKTAQTIDAAIGVANYDIGHNFNTSGGGNAGCIACVCLSTSQSGTHKGRGMTGRSDPTGDAFDIDYVAHEMGHQFGGYHTMNTCSRSGSGSTEVEPTSGSTIMGYAGICTYNIQSNSDDYFAYVNIRDISANVQSGNSSSCAQVINITNNAPTANAGLDYTIPKSTAFVLTGIGTDPDGNSLTYTWEQNDPAQSPAATAPVSTWTVGPLFRSIKGTTSPLRYFPNITSIIANNLTPAYEVVPSVSRTLNFSLVVRDNVISGGQTANDLMVVTVNGTAGPFTVSAPNTAVTWAAGSVQTVTWNVSGTTAAPVSCANVDILLSHDGGFTYPDIILTNTPNDGTQTITVPNIPFTTCRIMVKGSGNIFFDISNTNFTITGSTNSIASGAISGSPFCAGAAVNVPFTKSGTFNAGNVFTAQLSNAAGSFTAPVNIGTLTSTAAGTISSTIPAGTLLGTGYRIRVISSSPVVTGTDNGINLTINSLLTPSITVSASSSTICTGTSVTFTATPANGGTPVYQWKLNGANVGSNSATYINGTLANGNIITCVMTSSLSCTTSPTATSNTITMTVTSAVTPTVAITASATTICSGTSVTFTATSTNGGTPTYQWKLNGANVGTNSATYTNGTLANGNIITCVMTSSLSCATSSTANSNVLTMIVNPVVTPTVSIAASATTICSGVSVSFTATPTNGGTPTYQWKLNGANVGTNSATYTNGTLANGDVVTCILTSSLSCPTSPTSTSNPVTMTVNALVTPTVAISASATTICNVTPVTFTATPTNGGTPSYQWKLNGVNVGTSSTTYTNSTLANGDLVTCIMSSSLSCVTSPTGTSNIITMTVNAPVPPTATGNSRCGTGTVNLSATGSGALHWFDASTGGTDLGTGTTYTTPSVSSTTTYYVEDQALTPSQYVGPLSNFAAGQYSNTSYTLNFNCLTACILVSVAVDKQAAGSIVIQLTNAGGTVLQTGTFTVPAGASRVTLNWPLTVATGLKLVGPATASLWRVNTGGTFPFTLAGLVSITSCSSGTRYGSFFDWEIKESGCTSSRTPVVATVNPAVTPSVAITASAITICSGTSVTFTAIPTNGGTPTYQWKLNGANVGTNSTTYINGALTNGDVVTCDMTSSLLCITSPVVTSNAITMTVSTTVTPSVAISASATTICSGTSVTFTATPANGGTPTYQWKLNGANAGANSATYTNGALVNGAVVTCDMTSSLSCATTPNATSNTVIITVNPSVTPAVSIAASATTICSGTSVTFTATPTNGGTPAYQWKLNGTNVGTNSATYTNGAIANNDLVSCVMSSSLSCTTSPTVTSNSVTMTVNLTVTPSVSISASATNICTGTSVIFTAIPANGGIPSYQWQLNGVNVGSNSDTYTNGTLVNGDEVTCDMTASLTCVTNSAATSNTVTMAVNSVVTPSVSIVASATTICSGTSVTFIATSLNGGTPTYQWQLNGVNDGINSATYVNGALTDGDFVTCNLTTTLICATSPTATSNTLTITVSPTIIQDVSIVASATTICSGTSVSFTATPTNGGTPFYQWQLNGVNVGTNGDTYTNGTLVNGDEVTCDMTTSLTCATNSVAASNIVTMAVNPVVTPSVSISASAASICAGTSVTFTATSINGGTPLYQWQLNGINSGTNSATYSNATLTDGDVVTCELTSSLLCAITPSAISNAISMTILATPNVFAGVDQTICEGSSVILTGSNADTYFWNNGVNNGVSFVPTSGVFVYTVTGITNGCSNTDQVIVTVNAVPNVNAGYDQSVCEGSFVILSGSGASTFSWDNGVTNATQFLPSVGVLTYTVTGTINGCVNTDQVIVTVNPIPAVNAGPDRVICEGAYIALSGSGATSYFWNNGVTDGATFIPLLGVNIYNVTGIQNGCSNTDQVIVTVNALPIVDAGIDQTVCFGTSVTLSGSGAATSSWNNGITDGLAFTPSVGSVTYTLTGTTNECSANDQVVVTVNAVDNYTVTSNGPALAVSNLFGALYQWIDCDNGNTYIAGETNSSYTATANGNYSVIINQNGCTSTSGCTYINITEILQDISISDITVYPNPTKGILNIHFGSDLKDVSIVLENVIGQKVFEVKEDQTKGIEKVIDLGKFATGIYFINITNKDINLKYKIIYKD